MRKYAADKIRNVALIGHGSAGKTSLAEAMLFMAGATERLGKVEAGTTASDTEPDEVARQISINTALLSHEWEEHKINLLDTPGYTDFIGEVITGLRVADAVVLVVDGVAGPEVGTERYLEMARQAGLPVLVAVNKLDKENSDFSRVVGMLREHQRLNVIPLYLPTGAVDQFTGLVDVRQGKVYTYTEGKPSPIALPEALAAAAAAREALQEAAAEADDELTMKYLEEGELSAEEVVRGLRASTRAGKVAPAVPVSALKLVGVTALLDMIVSQLPSPAERPAVRGTNPRTGQEEERRPAESEPMASLVFKTMADPFAGRLSCFRTYSGVLHSDTTVYNANKGGKERIGQAFLPRGKQQQWVPAVPAGDLAVVAKLHETTTGDTLCDEARPLVLPGLSFPVPAMSFAVGPKQKGEEDKVAAALQRLAEEDPTLKVGTDPNTKELLLSGMGDLHLEVTVERARRKFGVEIVTGTPRVAYRETIRRAVKVQGKHKKQTGGRGQYGEVWVEFTPLERGSGFEFEDKVVGGAVPRNYIPAVEKGIREGMERGPLAGYPVVEVRASLYDGSYHSVDSSDMAFKIAGALALQKGMQEGQPMLLEPIMNVEVQVPEANMGDVIGLINSRRGRILGMEAVGSMQVVRAQVPQSEMFAFPTELRSMTQGRGSYSMSYAHYEELPEHLAQAVVAEAKERQEK